MRYSFALLALAAGSVFAAGNTAPLPWFFIEDSATRFVIEAPRMRAVFTSDGAAFQAGEDLIRVRFGGADGDVAGGVELRGAQPEGHANFLVGQDTSAWRTGLPTYRQIVYRHLYPGIDLAYSAGAGQFKSEFRVAPGADPRRIRLEYSADLSVDDTGRLHAGILTERAPEIYQESAAGRVKVEGHYLLIDSRTAGFEIPAYDPELPLVIDPVISYSTYLGGTGAGAVTGVAVDAAGSLYVTGWTEALNFPIVGPEQAVNMGGVDAFVVKLNPSGSALLYATYIGGGGEDKGAAIAVDASGQAYVTGSTASTNFPLMAAMQTTLGGGKTAFALKLNAVGNALLYSTYLGGTNYDLGTAIAVDTAGNAYIAGDTQSANFPTVSAAQPAIGGATDAFVTKLTPAGALGFSTFLGGAAVEHAGGIAVDSAGGVYVAGGTYSANFPVLGAIQAANGGNQDAFVTKLTQAGAFAYSTYLGGSGSLTPEQANGIAVDSSGNAYVTGVTNSANFPVTAGSYQTVFGGISDAFVAKLNAAGSALVYSTYLGGSSFDWANGIALDTGGNAYVAGYSSSLDFPVIGGVQAVFGGLYDAFVSKVGPAGNGLGFSTFFGGSGSDTANAIAVDTNGNMFVGGQTSSADLPLAGAIQSANNGGSIGWLARLGVTAPPAQVPAVVSVTPPSGSGNAPVFTATFSDPGGATALTTLSLLVSASASTNFACYVSYDRAANLFSLANDNPATGSQTVAPGGSTAQNSQCLLVGAGSSASAAGNTLTVNVSLSFLPVFSGAKTVYLYAADAGANTGWVSAGAWTVSIPPSQPSADTVSPNASTGPGQVFTFVFSDSQNAANLTGMGILFATSLTFTNACYLVVDRTAGTVGLVWDNGLGSDTRLLAGATALQNSQCVVGTSTITPSGFSQILTFNIVFKAGFGGTRNIYMYGASGAANTGWVQRGAYSVTAGGAPMANSVVPGSGSGPGQRFSFTVSDPGGSSYINGVAILFAPTFSNINACQLVYDRTANRVSLGYENPLNGAAPLVPGSNSIVSNNQCTLYGANTTVVIGTTSLVVTVDLTFAASWFGPKNMYLLASEGSVNSGWVTVGVWNVTGGAPTADSVSPSSGSGNSPNFTFTVSDSSSQANISGISILITAGAPTAIANACYLVYNRGNSTIGLYDDAATTLTIKIIGSSTTMQNTQCAVGYAVMTTSGNSVMFTVNTVFRTFSGAKTVYMQALEPNTSTGWVQRGTWTVP